MIPAPIKPNYVTVEVFLGTIITWSIMLTIFALATGFTLIEWRNGVATDRQLKSLECSINSTLLASANERIQIETGADLPQSEAETERKRVALLRNVQRNYLTIAHNCAGV